MSNIKMHKGAKPSVSTVAATRRNRLPNSHKLTTTSDQIKTTILSREEVLATLRSHETEIREMGVKELWLFGSVARNEATFKSDVDLMGKLTGVKSFFELFHLQAALKSILKVRQLDFVQNVYKELRPFIMKERIRVF